MKPVLRSTGLAGDDCALVGVCTCVAARVSTHVGVAWFTGQIELTGWTMLHPDADLRNVAVCFEADEASAARMPRWEHDERRPWFCFTNRDDAQRMLGPPSDRVPATIVIEQFTIHRGLTDEVNGARLVSVRDSIP